MYTACDRSILVHRDPLWETPGVLGESTEGSRDQLVSEIQCLVLLLIDTEHLATEGPTTQPELPILGYVSLAPPNQSGMCTAIQSRLEMEPAEPATKNKL